jgi:hypothetical protein
MNKGYAFGFLLILLVLILGFYVAYTGLVSGRETLRAQRLPEGAAQEAGATSISSTRPVLEITPAQNVTPTGSPEQGQVPTQGLTTTLTITSAALPTELPATPTIQSPTAPTFQPAQTAAPFTEPVTTPTAAVSDSGTPPAQPPTPIAAPAHQYRLAGPPAANPDYPICCYIYGTVQDAAGNGLEGISVQVANEWNPPIVAVTKGGGEIGNYDIPINASVVNWEIALVDVAGNQISTKVQIQFDATAANGYRIDWQRTY